MLVNFEGSLESATQCSLLGSIFLVEFRIGFGVWFCSRGPCPSLTPTSPNTLNPKESPRSQSLCLTL